MKSKHFVAFGLAICAIAVFLVASSQTSDIIDDSKELFKEIQLFSDSITLINTDYVAPVKVKDLVYGAIRGMMNTLDGYSQFMDPESFREITEETKGEFGGLGIEIGMRDGLLTVIAPIEGTPAFLAGIQAGDKIVEIDGQITSDMAIDDAIKKLRGDAGTEITISVIREGVDEILNFKVVRAIIKLESIKDVRILEDDIGYVRLAEFQEHTAKDLRKHIKELEAKGAKNLILDLRNNPGGLLDAAIEASDLFLKPGTLIVYTEGREPTKRMEFKARKRADFDSMNIVILVNRGSASASEILAGALQDNKRALIIGVPTFGKGSVQTVIPLQDHSALRLTTAAYYTPAGRNLMDKGIEPDVFVERMELAKPEKEEIETEKSKIFEKVKKEKSIDKEKGKKELEEKKEIVEYDNQVAAAINILKGIRVMQGYERK